MRIRRSRTPSGTRTSRKYEREVLSTATYVFLSTVVVTLQTFSSKPSYMYIANFSRKREDALARKCDRNAAQPRNHRARAHEKLDRAVPKQAEAVRHGGASARVEEETGDDWPDDGRYAFEEGGTGKGHVCVLGIALGAVDCSVGPAGGEPAALKSREYKT